MIAFNAMLIWKVTRLKLILISALTSLHPWTRWVWLESHYSIYVASSFGSCTTAVAKMGGIISGRYILTFLCGHMLCIPRLFLWCCTVLCCIWMLLVCCLFVSWRLFGVIPWGPLCSSLHALYPSCPIFPFSYLTSIPPLPNLFSCHTTKPPWARNWSSLN